MTHVTVACVLLFVERIVNTAMLAFEGTLLACSELRRVTYPTARVAGYSTCSSALPMIRPSCARERMLSLR